MPEKGIPESMIKEAWHSYMTTGDMPLSVRAPWFGHKTFRPMVKRLPKNPRCGICYIPFAGIGGYLSRTFIGVKASTMHPNMCNLCEKFATKYHGGVELDISIMFIDVRGSTTMAENMSPEDYSRRMNKFYRAATNAFYKNNGLVEKLIGDEVVGFFVPGFAGAEFAKAAVKTGKDALKALGYSGTSKPWMPAGVGIHTGPTYIGSVDTESGVSNISILGDSVNTAARLTSIAAPGEIVISEETRVAAQLPKDGLDERRLMLKGKAQEVLAWSLKI